MKRNALSFFLIVIVCVGSRAAVHIANNNYNAPLGVNHHASASAAAAAASPNDTIYVIGSPTPYPIVTPDKTLTWIGPGYRPQKDNPHQAWLDFNFINGWGNGTRILGLKCGNITAGGGSDNIEIAYCQSPGGVYITSWGFNIHDNVFMNAQGIQCRGGNNLIHNNIFNNVTDYNISTAFGPYNGNMVYNNLFLSGGGGHLFGAGVTNFVITNNIFYQCAAMHPVDYTPTNCDFSRNLTYNTPFDTLVYGTNYSSSGVNWINVQPQFVNGGATFDFALDFNLVPGTEGTPTGPLGGGTDGTDIGTFGGVNPFDNFTGMQNIPVVKKLDVLNPVVGVNDPIQIHVIVTSR